MCGELGFRIPKMDHKVFMLHMYFFLCKKPQSNGYLEILVVFAQIKD